MQIFVANKNKKALQLCINRSVMLHRGRISLKHVIRLLSCVS